PPGKMSPVKTWQPDTVFYKGEIATHRGATYQAQCDTAKAPWTEDWALLAAAGAPGKNPVMRGTYNPAAEYSQLDCVALNGSTFIALRDAAGACPGAHWQLVASCGKRGPKGELSADTRRRASCLGKSTAAPTSRRRSWLMAAQARLW